MYTQEKVIKAIETYKQTGSITATITRLGYPSTPTLLNWRNYDELKADSNQVRQETRKPRNARKDYSPDFKLNAVKRCFEKNEEIKKVAKELGLTRPTLYNWRKKYLKGGVFGLMKKHEIGRGPLNGAVTSPAESSHKEIKELQTQVQDLQMEIDILKEVIGVLKKDPGIDRSALKNREKVVIIDALEKKYPLLRLMRTMNLAHSCYYYHLSLSNPIDKLETLTEQIRQIFTESYESYGYRRIQLELNKSGLIKSEKIIRRLMKKMEFYPKKKKTHAYSSYQGEITPALDNLVNRCFSAELKNELWLTDITEFSIPAGKLYCSPIIDCYDGLIVSWSLSESPNAALANSSLKQACETLSGQERPVIHSARGGHYRWLEWIEMTEKCDLIRSMSKKGYSADNSACEGFFGRMKNECFYERDFSVYTMKMFKDYINHYLNWHNNDRIKLKFKCSSMQNRIKLGIA